MLFLELTMLGGLSVRTYLANIGNEDNHIIGVSS
jgi:hypothetical protein